MNTMSSLNQFRLPLPHVLLLSFVMAALAACSNGEDKISLDPAKNFQDVVKAASGPLEDLNLRREEIPPMLKVVVKDPYAMPLRLQCATIKTELAELDAVLGPDIQPTADVQEENEDSIIPTHLKMPDIPTNATLVNKGANAAHDRLMSFISSQTNIMPFRSIIRTISGANAHAKKRTQAFEAGKMRRAYLKGLANAQFGMRCLLPAGVLEVNATPLPHS